MKKFAQIAALSAAAALALAACGDAPQEAPTNTQSSSAGETAEAVDFKGCMVSDEGGFDDNSFNETSFSGLLRASEELRIETGVAESADAGQYISNVDSMIQSSCDIIFNVGFNLADVTGQSAEANPDQHFAIIDSGVDPARDNVKPLLFNTHEAAYLAGYVAAGVSKTGTVATFGGMNIPSVTIFMDGFADGVAKFNEDNDADVRVLGWDKAKPESGSFTDNFSEIGKGKELSEQFIAQGADVIMPVAGPVGEGAMAAASEHDGVYVIGVDTDAYDKYDSYRDILLTSVLKAMDTAVFDTSEAALGGTFDATPYVGTLENGGVGLADFHNLDSEVPAEVKTKVEELKAAIIDGSLVVESPSATTVE